MPIGFLLKLTGLIGIPEKFQRIAAYGLLAVAAFILVLGVRGCIIHQHDAKMAAKVERKAAEGDKAGQEAANKSKEQGNAETDKARKAANDSDDPLRAAMCSLRGEPEDCSAK